VAAKGAPPGGNVDDAGVLRFRQQGHKGVGHPHHPEHVGVQYRARVLGAGLLQGLEGTGDAGVVDQHVQAPVLGAHPLGGGVDADLVGDVQAQAGHPELVGGGPAPFGITRADQHGVPGLLQASRALEAQALVPAGDHSDGVHDHHGGGRDGGAEGAVGR